MTKDEAFSYFPAILNPGKGEVPEKATAGAFILRKGTLLLEKRPDHAKVYPSFWDTPGGHVETGEPPEAALLREMKEELGIEPLHFFLGAVQDHLETSTNLFYRHYLYIVTQWEGEPASREGRRVKWFPVNEAKELRALNPLIGYALNDFVNKGWIGEA